MQPTAHLHQVLPTTRVETAEERLAHDVEELISAVQTTDSALDVRRVEAHVAVDERRVRSLRALPCHRCAEADVRWSLAAAYDDLADAYRERGRRDRSAWAATRALEERDALDLAA
ncbi:hypothetical protein AB0L40_21450 [Patulibacter sp. NPDC049589]|uniref:hypothetical protein n=1 Tax=Patulibacter sp. NPDC049589 TaxID=3154731 RepID=UPI00342711B4